MTPNVVKILPRSDGDPSKWPNANNNKKQLVPMDDTKCRTRVGKWWMEERGQSSAGQEWIIDHLPAGYRHYGRKRPSSNHVDYYVCGHPTGYRFDSYVQFFKHFITLMNQNGGSDCQCLGCTSKQRSSPRGATSASSKSRSSGTSEPPPPPSKTADHLNHTSMPPPPIAPSAEDRTEMVDEEGTSDIWKQLAKQLEDDGSVNVPIEEPDSIDWTVEHRSLPQHTRLMQQQPRWMPRTGELVLFIRDIPSNQTLHFDEDARSFRLWDSRSASWTGLPIWEAGVVTETSEEPATIKDLVMEVDKSFQVAYSGFRVEPMPEIGSDDKSWSKRSTYVPLHQIRPFCFWREFLRGTERADYHPTVWHAMGAAASFSVYNKYHFKGTFPSATVFCKGLYIGSELMLVGDVVRLTTPEQSDITEILYVTSIKLKLLDIGSPESAFGPDAQSSAPPWYTCIHVSGVAFTTDPTKACSTEKHAIDAKTSLLPEGLDGYGRWYYVHAPEQRMEVPFQRVLGRCFEDEAMMLWFPSKMNSRSPTPVKLFSAINSGKGKGKARMTDQEPEADLSLGLQGTLKARTYASANDPRVVREEGKTWFWGDSRVQQLGLSHVKNVDVGDDSTFSGDLATLPRQRLCMDAMRKARRLRETGYKGPGMKGLSGRNVVPDEGKFAKSGLVASGLNASLNQDEDSESDDGVVEVGGKSQHGVSR